MPLNPTVANVKTEIPGLGLVAMALNGVPTYGAKEADGNNAVEPGTGKIQDAQFWYGHAGMSLDWHVHNPQMGESSVTSTMLLGYAMDGFPIYGPVSDTSQLDACNGIANGDGSYQYHVRSVDQIDANLSYCNGSSPETNWNYVLGCYSGSVANTRVLDSSYYTLPSDCVADGPSTSSPTAAPITSSPTGGSTAAPTKAPSPTTTTSSPVASPTTIEGCVDSELRVMVNGKPRACAWAQTKNTAKRCAKGNGRVGIHCAQTCGVCATYACEDSTKRFYLSNGNAKSCNWVKAKNTEIRCAKEGIDTTCRSTCQPYNPISICK